MIGQIGLFILPYAIVLAVGYVLGFMSRNSKIDTLQATITKQYAELNGIEIRTSRTEEPVRPVQPRTRTSRTARPMYGPEHSAARTEPLPTGVRYVAAAEADEDDAPVSDREYVEMHGFSKLD